MTYEVEKRRMRRGMGRLSGGPILLFFCSLPILFKGNFVPRIFPFFFPQTPPPPHHNFFFLFLSFSSVFVDGSPLSAFILNRDYNFENQEGSWGRAPSRFVRDVMDPARRTAAPTLNLDEGYWSGP